MSEDSDNNPSTGRILAYSVPILLGLALLVGAPVSCSMYLAQQTTARVKIVCDGANVDPQRSVLCDRALQGFKQ